MDILACRGDIVDETSDILVSPADTQLSMSGGAASALRQAAGETLQTAVAQYETVDVGDAILTPTSELFADYVVHAVAKPDVGPATEETVRAAVQATVSKAVENECSSIVFPLIGSGVGRIPSETSAKIILEEVKAINGLDEARIITRSQQEYRQTADLIERTE